MEGDRGALHGEVVREQPEHGGQGGLDVQRLVDDLADGQQGLKFQTSHCWWHASPSADGMPLCNYLEYKG
jgi:hypothetical protein